MSTQRETLSKKLSEDIIHRYALFTRNEDGHSNPVIDSYMPKLIALKIMGSNALIDRELRNMPNTKYAISEYFANMTETRQLPFQYMSELLGFRKADIKKLLLKVKSKNHKMVMIGFGGTNANTWWWLSKMCEWTGIINVFNSIDVVDNDSIELHNILRFPFDLSNKSGNTSKISMFDNHAKLAKNYSARSRYFPCRTENCCPLVALKENEEDYIEVDEGNYIKLDDENTFIYGAPTLDSRIKLKNTRFIAATHGDDHCSMTVCPDVDTGLLTESYGMIRLNTFFMNHVRMSIGLLEFLADDDPNKWIEKNRKIFEYDFKKAIENNELGRTEKTIFFDTNHDGSYQDL